MSVGKLSADITVYASTHTLCWHHCICLCTRSLLISLYMPVHTLSAGITIYVCGQALYWHHCICQCTRSLLASLYMSVGKLSTGISLCPPTYLNDVIQLSYSFPSCLDVVDATQGYCISSSLFSFLVLCKKSIRKLDEDLIGAGGGAGGGTRILKT